MCLPAGRGAAIAALRGALSVPPAEISASADGQDGLYSTVTSTTHINEGASVKDGQAHLGHADSAVTLNVYSAVFEGRREDLTQRLESVRSRASASGRTLGSGTEVARATNTAKGAGDVADLR